MNESLIIDEKLDRYITLKSMNEIVLRLKNKEAMKEWLNWFVDSPTTDDFNDYIENDDVFGLCVNAFKDILKKYLDEGLCVGGVSC